MAQSATRKQAFQNAVSKDIASEKGIVSKNINVIHEESLTFGQRLADSLAEFAGSWTFIIAFAVAIAVWMALNTVIAATKRFDPYPFILLNLVLSCMAAVQAPLIMMSQNRQEARDRLRAENDYQVNVKAEEEIESLHDKIDHLLEIIEAKKEELAAASKSASTVASDAVNPE